MTYCSLFESITSLDEVSPKTKLTNSFHLKCPKYRPGGLSTHIAFLGENAPSFTISHFTMLLTDRFLA